MSSNDTKTRTRILDAAAILLEESGGRGVRMSDIAKRAGLSRQAIYLHFASRTELLTATTRHLDKKLNLDARLKSSRTASNGLNRLDAYIAFWGNYVPEIHSAARALMTSSHQDEAAADAWADRMEAMRDGCRAAVEALSADGILASEWEMTEAIDLLWTMLSVSNWEHLTITCGWSLETYVKNMQTMARRTLTNGMDK